KVRRPAHRPLGFSRGHRRKAHPAPQKIRAAELWLFLPHPEEAQSAVSKDGAASWFETPAAHAPHHEAEKISWLFEIRIGGAIDAPRRFCVSPIAGVADARADSHRCLSRHSSERRRLGGGQRRRAGKLGRPLATLPRRNRSALS